MGTLKIIPREEFEAEKDLGAVMTYITSPTKTLFVYDESKRNPLCKLPGGSVEANESVLDAAVREVFEETGIQLLKCEVTLMKEHRRENGFYYPHFCHAIISEGKMKARQKIGDEDGSPIKTKIFNRSEIRMKMDIIERHIQFIREMEGC